MPCIAESEEDRLLMWQAREQMSECQSREGASIKHDVSVPVAAVPQLIAEGIAAAKKVVPDIRPVPFGHIGRRQYPFQFQPAGRRRRQGLHGRRAAGARCGL